MSRFINSIRLYEDMKMLVNHHKITGRAGDSRKVLNQKVLFVIFIRTETFPENFMGITHDHEGIRIGFGHEFL